MVKQFAMTCLTILVLTPALADADPVVIKQAGKAFSERKLSVTVGESVAFLNDDDVTHNVYSRSDTLTFDLGAQPPGDEQTLVFDTPGKVKIRCAVHPRMKLDVTVE